MNNAHRDFLKEGMQRYKEATDVLRTFVSGIEDELKQVLDTREEWSPLSPTGESAATSTKYWSTYPLLNARRGVTYKGAEYSLVLNINWSEAEGNYPFYAVALVTSKERLSVAETYTPTAPFFTEQAGLCMYPDPEDFDIQRDFTVLIDEFLQTL